MPGGCVRAVGLNLFSYNLWRCKGVYGLCMCMCMCVWVRMHGCVSVPVQGMGTCAQAVRVCACGVDVCLCMIICTDLRSTVT